MGRKAYTWQHGRFETLQGHLSTEAIFLWPFFLCCTRLPIVIASGSKPALQAIFVKLEQHVSAASSALLHAHHQQQHQQQLGHAQQQRHQKERPWDLGRGSTAAAGLPEAQHHEQHQHLGLAEQQQQLQQEHWRGLGRGRCDSHDGQESKRRKLGSSAVMCDAFKQQQGLQQQHEQQEEDEEEGVQDPLSTEQLVAESLSSVPLLPVVRALVLGFAAAAAGAAELLQAGAGNHQQQEKQQEGFMQTWQEGFVRVVVKLKVLHAPLVLLLHAAMQGAAVVAGRGGGTGAQRSEVRGKDAMARKGAATDAVTTDPMEGSSKAAARGDAVGTTASAVAGGVVLAEVQLQEASGQFLAALSALQVQQGLQVIYRHHKDQQQEQQQQKVEEVCGVESQRQLQPRSHLSLPGGSYSRWGSWGNMVVGYRGLGVGLKRGVAIGETRLGGDGVKGRVADAMAVAAVDEVPGVIRAETRVGKEAMGAVAVAAQGEQLAVAAAVHWLQMVKQQAAAEGLGGAGGGMGPTPSVSAAAAPAAGGGGGKAGCGGGVTAAAAAAAGGGGATVAAAAGGGGGGDVRAGRGGGVTAAAAGGGGGDVKAGRGSGVHSSSAAAGGPQGTASSRVDSRLKDEQVQMLPTDSCSCCKLPGWHLAAMLYTLDNAAAAAAAGTAAASGGQGGAAARKQFPAEGTEGVAGERLRPAIAIGAAAAAATAVGGWGGAAAREQVPVERSAAVAGERLGPAVAIGGAGDAAGAPGKGQEHDLGARRGRSEGMILRSKFWMAYAKEVERLSWWCKGEGSWINLHVSVLI